MAGRRLLYSGAAVGSDMNNVLLQNKRPPSDSPFLSRSSSFLGSRSMFSFGDVSVRNQSERSFFRSFDQDENGDEDEDYDEYFHQPEKKRRLKADQIQFLEKSFEADNKLEPERKIQLAKDLGLQPRQVAIWFQNRRARWKTKTLERDYDVLQDSYNGLKADYDNLLKEKEKLKAEVLDLTDKLLLKEKEKGDLKLFDKQILFEAPRQEHITNEASELIVSKDSVVDFKQEDLNSVKSDVFDSDSPYYTDGVHSSLLEPGDSSYVLEPDQSDMSQDEEVNFRKNLLLPLAYIFPKIGDNNYSDPPANSCYFGFPIEEDQPFGFWAY